MHASELVEKAYIRVIFNTFDPKYRIGKSIEMLKRSEKIFILLSCVRFAEPDSGHMLLGGDSSSVDSSCIDP